MKKLHWSNIQLVVEPLVEDSLVHSINYSGIPLPITDPPFIDANAILYQLQILVLLIQAVAQSAQQLRVCCSPSGRCHLCVRPPCEGQVLAEGNQFVYSRRPSHEWIKSILYGAIYTWIPREPCLGCNVLQFERSCRQAITTVKCLFITHEVVGLKWLIRLWHWRDFHERYPTLNNWPYPTLNNWPT